MTLRLVRFLACGALCLAASCVDAFAAANDCDRACLKSTLDQYLNAVLKHDPAAAPLSPGFRQTDNAIVVRQGTGVWRTVTALGKVQRRYLDPASGQAAFFGTVEEGANAAIVTVRVKVENRKITEAEWYLARRGDPGLNGPQPPGQPAGNFFNPDNLATNPPPERTVPRGERLPREALIGITNSYFDGIMTHDGSIILAHPGCTRLENGETVTGRPLGQGPGAGKGKAKEAAKAGGPLSDCTSNLTNINVLNVAARRYPVVDEEAQVVLALAIFQRRPGTATRRNVFSEWFAIDGGKIRTIHSAMFYPPPDAPAPNWPPFEGNWPVPAEFAPPAQNR